MSNTDRMVNTPFSQGDPEDGWCAVERLAEAIKGLHIEDKQLDRGINSDEASAASENGRELLRGVESLALAP